MKPIILIVCDELVSLNKIDPQYLNQLEGIKKFSNRMINFPHHYTNSTPCSAARSVIYTGQHINKTKITENIETGWQLSLKSQNPWINTFGNYFKNLGYRTNYKGKFHLTKELIPTIPITYKPLIATQTYLQTYGFDEFEKFGDFCFDRRLGTFNDELVVEQKLPIGNTKTNCDYWDPITNYGYDGVIPFFKGPKSQELFALVVNFDNPHDIKNSNIETNITTITNTTTQIIGFNSDTVPSISDYNLNFKLFSDLEFYLKESFELNNCFNSLVNHDSNNCGIIAEIGLKYLFYGTEYFNSVQAQQYQTAYYRLLKQVDSNLNRLYDYFDSNGLFDTCVICLTSDHGDYVGSHGLYQKASPIYDSAYHVPLMISYPGLIKDDIIVPPNLITSHINLLPTLLTLCGGENYLLTDLLKDLAPGFMNKMGQPIDSDYNVVKLSLSILFGPMLIPSLKNLNLDTVDNLIKFKTSNSNYLTLQSFSVSSIINLETSVYNCGYYFSLLDVYLASVKLLKLSMPDYLTDNSIYLLTDSKYDFGFVGLKKDLILLLQTNCFVQDNFDSIDIVLYDKSDNTNKFKNNLGYNDDNSIEIIAKNNNISILNNIFNWIPTVSINVYQIVNSQGDIIFGNLEDIQFIIKNNILPDNFIFSSIEPFEKIDLENIYVYPFYVKSKLYFHTKKFNRFKKFILTNFDTFFRKILQTIEHNQIKDLVSSNFIYTIIIVDYIIKNNGKLALPGVDLDLNALTSRYFVEIYNITQDPNEIVNLADSSRINKFYKLLTELITKLYTNIDKNDLRNIFISTPAKYYFSQEFTKETISNNNF